MEKKNPPSIKVFRKVCFAFAVRTGNRVIFWLVIFCVTFIYATSSPEQQRINGRHITITVQVLIFLTALFGCFQTDLQLLPGYDETERRHMTFSCVLFTLYFSVI